jgi:hypothetical protein
VGHIHTIFQLPEQFHYPHPLAYVQWYTEFQTPTPGVQMYPVSLACGLGATTVIRLDSIRRSCHLIPVFGAKIDQTLDSESVLDKCSLFYVSDFLDLYTYQFFNDY